MTLKKDSKDQVQDVDLAEKPKKKTIMDDLYAEIADVPELGALVEGKVTSIARNAVYVDLPPFGTGVIYGREYLIARDILRKVNVGDAIDAKVVEVENEDGYIELSLKEARQAFIWSEAEEMMKEKKVIEIMVKDANKGGLILEWQGISGFIPTSQLKSEHYPRVEDGNKDKILEALQRLVSKKITVMIIAVNPKEGKLIFSEKGLENEQKIKLVDQLAVGDDIEGEITGVVDFGAFVKVRDGLEGLVHISEMDWGLVEDPRSLFRVGEKVKARIIEIKDGKVSLSIKALKKNPWQGAESKYKKGDFVEAVIIKFNKHGALASVEEGIAGLVHVSEFGGEESIKEKLELGKRYKFTITLFDASQHKMTLAFGEKKLDEVKPRAKKDGKEEGASEEKAS